MTISAAEIQQFSKLYRQPGCARKPIRPSNDPICVSPANRGEAESSRRSSYQVYGTNPSIVWFTLTATRSWLAAVLMFPKLLEAPHANVEQALWLILSAGNVYADGKTLRTIHTETELVVVEYCPKCRGQHGGAKAAKSMSAGERSKRARKGARARWPKKK